MTKKLATIGMALIAISVSLSLIGSVHAFDANHIQETVTKGTSYLKSYASLMYACADLTVALDTAMTDKCSVLNDKLVGALEQMFTESKADMDEIMKHAIDLKTQGTNSNQLYNYPAPNTIGPQEYSQ